MSQKEPEKVNTGTAFEVPYYSWLTCYFYEILKLEDSWTDQILGEVAQMPCSPLRFIAIFSGKNIHIKLGKRL